MEFALVAKHLNLINNAGICVRGYPACRIWSPAAIRLLKLIVPQKIIGIKKYIIMYYQNFRFFGFGMMDRNAPQIDHTQGPSECLPCTTNI